ncbi:MAG: YfcE family phosphodiesterase [Proteobacteria bacterium]|nr:YfcE family phosphodiesterase [Pseudomonadota bacterium]MBU1686281.1 YfcE family phosphodiesterase [Pseudomonadota bacterium]
MIRIGVLSDTHLGQPDELFQEQVGACFKDIGIILHAGDLTSAAVIETFADKKFYGVQGNMCDASSRSLLPECRKITIGDKTLVLVHGHRYGYHDLEERLYNEFYQADCIVYGHTHTPSCHRIGDILMVNPGSFLGTGRYGSRGTYAILEFDNGIRGQIFEVPRL